MYLARDSRPLTVNFVIVFHKQKRIVVKITEELDIGLHTPVVLIGLKKFMLEEEAGVEPAHIAITKPDVSALILQTYPWTYGTLSA